MALTKEDLQSIQDIVLNTVKSVIHSEVDPKFTSIDKRFAQIDERFTQIDKRFAQIDEKFERIDQRFGQIDKKFDGVDERFNTIDQRFIEMKEYMDIRFTNLDRALETITTEVVSISGGILSDHEKRIQCIEKKIHIS